MLLGAVVTGGLALGSRSPAGERPSADGGFQQVALLETTAPVTTSRLSDSIDGAHGTRTARRTTTTTPPKPTTTTRVTTTVPVTTTTKPAPPATTPDTSQTDQVFALVNQNRQQAGCAPLKDDSRLDTAAQAHSDDMADNDYFSHTTPAGVTFDQREKAAGYPSPGGENIAQGQTSAQQVMTDWMNSPGHKANILNCQFTAIGIGLNTNNWYWTQDFGY